jgi:hypothetical protein
LAQAGCAYRIVSASHCRLRKPDEYGRCCVHGGALTGCSGTTRGRSYHH